MEKCGYNTKYASHALRLGRQGIELATTGSLTLPMRPEDLEPCVAVKRGHLGFTEAPTLVDEARSRLDQIIADNSAVLPDNPDMATPNSWMVAAHQR